MKDIVDTETIIDEFTDDLNSLMETRKKYLEQMQEMEIIVIKINAQIEYIYHRRSSKKKGD